LQTICYKQQCVSAGKFRKYDYGLIGNLFTYGHFSPPEYDLSKVTAKVALHYSDNDWLAAVRVSTTCQRVHCCPVANYYCL
jgi:hypothetical protein